jgi:tetratricopeptide (TPR) repeat protein
MAAEALSPASTTQGKTRRRPAIYIAGGAAILFIVAYCLAWLSAYNLTRDFMLDAEETLARGDYLNALMGYDEFDEEREQNVFRGGYAQVVNIWASEYAAPVPAEVERARARIDEIIDQRLTIEDAEYFVERNIGRSNPYLGRVYLRLGELYEEEGDLRTAEDIYEEVIDFFAQEPDVVDRAQTHLDQLQQAENDNAN